LLFGCGSGTGTNGSLTLAEITTKDLSGGTYEISSTASFATADGKSPVGSDLNFTAVYTTPSGASQTRTQTYELSPNGLATFSDTVIQGTEPVYIKITVSIGGLSQSRTASVPTLAQ
jgi:hypothetical protein